MCVAPGAVGTANADGDGGAKKTPRHSKPAYEKPENRASMSRAKATPSPLQATIEKLATPADPCADPELTQAQLEERRQFLLQEALEVSRLRLDLEICIHEYNKANCFKPVTPRVVVGDAARDKGKNLNDDFAKVAEPSSKTTSMSGSYTSTVRPKYSSPAKNLRAAQAAAEELPHLTGDALIKQQA